MRIRRGKAFRPGTQANHRSVAQLYAAFAINFQVPDFPAPVSSLLLFAEFLLRSYRAHKSVVNALSSLRTFHLSGVCERLLSKTTSFHSLRGLCPSRCVTFPLPRPPYPLHVWNSSAAWRPHKATAGRPSRPFSLLPSFRCPASRPWPPPPPPQRGSLRHYQVPDLGGSHFQHGGGIPAHKMGQEPPGGGPRSGGPL